MSTQTEKSYEAPKFENLRYLNGFGNFLQSEAIQGAVPENQNLPQKHPLGLYPEQVNLTTFTHPRSTAKLLWFHRIAPSNKYQDYQPLSGKSDIHTRFDHGNGVKATPASTMWKPLQVSDSESKDFVEGMHTLLGVGDPALSFGYAIHLYACNKA